jgi:Fe-S cluster biosynthesis and repair protein YggX
MDMPDRTVFCVKLHKELPGLEEPPFDTELGKKIYEQVSQDAWRMWTEHCKMLLNEYRLNPARKEDHEAIVKQMEQFFFGEGAALPKEYVPPPTH